MPAYAYPITIDYGKKTIKKEHSFTLEGQLTVDKLKKIVGDLPFSIGEEDPWEETYTIYWSEERLETDEEQANRIIREENYMKEYKKRQKK